MGKRTEEKKERNTLLMRKFLSRVYTNAELIAEFGVSSQRIYEFRDRKLRKDFLNGRLEGKPLEKILHKYRITEAGLKRLLPDYFNDKEDEPCQTKENPKKT